MGHPKRNDPVVLNERERRLGDLIAAPFLTLEDAALYFDLPISTMRKHIAEGLGPRTFNIGRRVYVTKPSLDDWVVVWETVAAKS